MFYLFNPDTMYVYGMYPTERGAKIARTRILKKDPAHSEMMVGDETAYNLYDEVIEVKNLMSGQMVKIRKSQKGSVCDPSTERYWSM